MISSSAILICDRGHLFRESLRNFLLAAGYLHIEIATTVLEALAKLRRERYGCILIGMTQPPRKAWRMAAVAKRRQPQAKLLLMAAADEPPFVQNDSFEYIIKEQVYSDLLPWLQHDDLN